ncbi:hypothetical protein C7212DRAFT_340680 [Tuber magnatum]|uniref:Uncharacterized protein n=1 Tax=Tuber magnatum TaxID=42249 RepID=A0A317T098_9PEZI|nr:hypothetical protein C7212DRAFT_340680 [Tuber magnatum]
MSPFLNTSEVYPPPESPPDASPFTLPSPPSSPPPRLVAYEDHGQNTASTVIAILSLCTIFLALVFLVGYGVFRFGTGFLLGKRVPRKRDGEIGGNAGISAGVSEVKGDDAQRGERGGGGLDTVVEVPGEEEEKEERRGDSRRSGAGRNPIDVESGRWW